MNDIPRARNGQRNHRLVRQLHLWIGAWGALAHGTERAGRFAAGAGGGVVAGAGLSETR